jgi:YidC/Oxa1 family membrane protein insertase
MEDQGKRLLLAVAIAFALMLVWSILFPPTPREAKNGAGPTPPSATQPGAPSAPGATGATPATGAGTSPTPPAPAAVGATPPPPAPAPVLRGEEQRFVFAFATLRAELSSYGGALVRWELVGKKYEDRKRGGQLDLVRTGQDERWLPLRVSFPESTLVLPERTEWRAQPRNEREIDFVWESTELRVVKRFKFIPEHYVVQLTVEVTKLAAGEAKQSLGIDGFFYEDPSASTSGSFTRPTSTAWSSVCHIDGEVKRNAVKGLQKGAKVRTGRVRWAGFAQSFFLAVVAPQPPEGSVGHERLTCTATAVAEHDGAMAVQIRYPVIAIKDGDPTYVRTVSAYFGPKYLDELETIASVIGYDAKLGDSVDLGWFGFIARPLLWLLQRFHDVVGNWGLAIILLTVLVLVVMLPMQTKSMRSMRAMSKLAPEVKKIQEKYKDDKQRQQVEIMNLYKAHKVNPLAGCLPLLLQMPIWFALYRSLSVAAELYQATFIPGWLEDMTAPDPYYIMPLLMTGAMFMQTRLSPATSDSAQQKIMMYGMPLMFGGMSLFFPSGLTVYIFTSTLLRTGHQLWMNRQDEGGKASAGKRSAVPAAASAADEGGTDGPVREADEDESDEGGVAGENGDDDEGGGEPDEGAAPSAAAPTPGRTDKPTTKRGGARRRTGRRRRARN